MSEKNKNVGEHSERFFPPSGKNKSKKPFGLMFKEQMPGNAQAEAGITSHPCATQSTKNSADINFDLDFEMS